MAAGGSGAGRAGRRAADRRITHGLVVRSVGQGRGFPEFRLGRVLLLWAGAAAAAGREIPGVSRLGQKRLTQGVRSPGRSRVEPVSGLPLHVPAGSAGSARALRHHDGSAQQVSGRLGARFVTDRLWRPRPRAAIAASSSHGAFPHVS